MTFRPALVVVVALALAAGTSCSQGSRSPAEPVAVPFVTVTEARTPGSTDAAVAILQARLRSTPTDDGARLELATAFLQKGREVADPAFATRAATLLDDLGRRRPDDPGVLVARAGLALTRHQFVDALELGERALELAPRNGAAFGVLADAANELGRYDEASAATQAMVDAKPDLASLVRTSFARELRGDLAGAVQAMTQALAVGPGRGENQAYAESQLGNLLVLTGDHVEAARAFDRADVAFPGFAPAQVGRARLLIADGRAADAARLLDTTVETVPAPEVVLTWADALAGAGRADEADDAAALVDAINELYRANGVQLDVELVLFDADNGNEDEALELAEHAVDARPGIFSHDALAWARFRSGDLDGARDAIDEALRLGTRDPQLRYHAAAINAAAGNRRAATEHLQIVQSTNPRFSARLWPEVRNLMAELGLEPHASERGSS